MTVIEVVSFATSIASLVLAVVAIVLSIVFYQMSSQLSESTKEAAKDIGASVEKLEKLFDRLYADTFSMMKDTVSDMRKHAWGEAATETPNILEEAEKKTEQKTEALRKHFDEQVAQILERQKITDGRVGQTREELKKLVDRAIDASRNVEHEAREETIRRYILKNIFMLKRRGEKILAGDIVDSLSEQFPQMAVVRELERMKAEKLIDWESEHLSSKTEIILTHKEVP
jgi:hypothetical protein